MRINQIINESGSKETLQVPNVTNSDLTVTAKLKDEVESMRRRLEEAEAARRSTEQRLSAAGIPSANWLLESQERDNADRVEPAAGEEREPARRRRDGASEGRSGEGEEKDVGRREGGRYFEIK